MTSDTLSPVDSTLTTLAADLRSGALTSRALLEATLEVVDAREGELNAFITVRDREELRAEADAADEALARDEDPGPLAGIPIAVKDNICTRGVRTTAASHMLDEFTPPYDATAVARLRAAGALLVGKTNLDEFAMGSSNENSHMGPVRNPHDPERIPGGSSGGSAAAVAAGMCCAALGSDTGGSVRQPASHCGVVGLKPTYGRVSRRGLIAFASSLDQIGTLTRSVEDAARVLGAIAGHDPLDMTSVRRDVPDWSASLELDPGEVVVGVPREFLDADGLDDDVAAVVRDACDALADRGADVREVSLPHAEYAVATYYLIATAEASSNLARYDGVRYGHRAPDAENLEELYERTRVEGFGAEVIRRIMLGTFVLSAGYYDAYYRKAQKVRTLIRGDLEEAFAEVDALVCPTAPSTAFRLGARLDDPLAMYLSDVFTTTCNLAGLPGLSVPFGADRDGLPVGVQLMAPHFREDTLLGLGRALERLRPPRRDRDEESEPGAAAGGES
jgi:aspartyl-tRNA(Asn)/glutamyl-tRNA(Gln) amidotransferase subunit A